MALKIDKDALLEILTKYKDQIFLGILVVVALYGGWRLYQSSSKTVDDIIKDVITAGPGRTGGTTKKPIVSSDITAKLISKKDREEYVLKSNPFGSPEDQVRIREQVQSIYERAVKLFEAGQYQQAIQEFDRVISLDVTETRIKYPILPSEYKRKAQREDARQNFGRILQTVKSDAAEGDRLQGEDKSSEALNVYQRASNNVASVIDSDPNGEAIGTENLNTLKTLQQDIDGKIREIQKTTLLEDLNRIVADAQNVSRSNNMIENLRARMELVQIQGRIASIDTNQQLISTTERNRVVTLLDQIQKKLAGNFALIVTQADQQFEQAVTDKDSAKAQESIWALRQALAFASTTEQSQDAVQGLQKKITNYVARRAQLVIDDAQNFYNAQKAILDQGNYEQFDQQTRIRHLNELTELTKANLTPTMKQDIDNLRRQLVSLKLPPPLTEAYEITGVEPKAGGSYEISYLDKTRTTRSSRDLKIRLREGNTDRRTKITLKQVDTDKGVVILSRPGYMDVEVPISSSK